MKDTKLVRLYVLKTEPTSSRVISVDGNKTTNEVSYKEERIELCTCADEDNVIRKIIQSYEDIWQNTVEAGYTSKDTIINTWSGSEILVEFLDSPGTFTHYEL